MKIQKYLYKVSKFVLLPTFLFAIALGLNTAKPAHADERPAYRLQISPTQDNIGTVQPGDTYTGKFNVQNTGAKTYSFKTEVMPLSVKGDDYQQDFDTVTKYTVMTDWAEITGATGTVEPNSESTVSYTLTIPQDAPAGLQAIAIMVTMVNDAEMQAAGIQTVSRAAYPVYLNVDGETDRSAEIISHKVPTFSFSPSIVTSAVVRNNGNIYTNAEYWLEVRGFFNDQLEYSNTKYVNGAEVPSREVIFPDSQRYTETTWDDAPVVGLFKVKSVVKIFDDVSTVEKIVIICPLWLIVLILLFLGLAIFWVVSRIIKRRDR